MAGPGERRWARLAGWLVGRRASAATAHNVGAAPEPLADARAPDGEETPQADDPVELAGDELDLRTFAPREVADAVQALVRWAADEGRARVRIIHGKGTGTLRRVVHAALARHPRVRAFGLCDERSGGWGATWAELDVAQATAPPRT